MRSCSSYQHPPTKDREVALPNFKENAGDLKHRPWLRPGVSKVDFFASGATYLVFGATLAFVRSDAVRLNDGNVGYAGNNGYAWSRTSNSSTNAYNLDMNPTNVNPSNANNRWYGFSLRCL